jgi:hypothetical protein
MPSERNRFDAPREYSFHRELIQDPERLRDRVSSSRDDEPLFNEEKILRENYSTSDTAAKFTLIAAAANLVSRRPLGKIGIAIASKLTGMLNSTQKAVTSGYLKYAATAGEISGSFTATTADKLRKTAEDTPLLGHLRIVKDLDNAMDTLLKLDTKGNFFSATGRNKEAPTANAKVFIDEMRERLKERYLGGSASAEGIEDLTVNQIITMSTNNVQRAKTVKMFGKEQIDSLVNAKKIGLLDGKQRIDKRIFLDKKSKEILDTRILSGSHLGDIANDALSKVQLPFVNLGLQDIFNAPIRHLFGKGDFSGVVRAPDASNPYTRRLVIGEELYRINPTGAPSGASLEHLSSGMRVRSRDGIGQAVIARRGQLSSQRPKSALDIKKSSSNPIMQLINAISEDVGIGRRFATQEAFVKRATVDLVKRRTQGTQHLKETTLLDDIVEEIAKRTSTSKTDGSDLDMIGRARQRLKRISRPEDRDLNFFEKTKRDLLAALGDEGAVQYLKKDPKTKKWAAVVDPVKGTKESDFGLRQAAPTEEIRGTAIGQKGSTPAEAAKSAPVRDYLPMDQFVYESGTASRVADVANFMTTRLNDLIGATMGIGFRPTPGMFGFAGNTAKVFGMAAGGALALEGVKYLDYLSGVPTGGYKISNLLLDTYGAAKISAQFLREFTGLSPAARYMEDLMPGSMESSASDFARTLAPFVIALKTAPNKPGMLLAAAISAFTGEFPFPGITETPRESMDILSGEQLVPMRSGRYWMLGKQPFKGGKVSYFAPGMFARMRSEYKYTDTLYGAQSEYFQNISFLPTPSNLFRVPELIGNILSPITNLPFLGAALEHTPLIGSMFSPQGDEFLAQKHRFDRPYPTAFAIESLSNRSISPLGVPGGGTPDLRAFQTPGESVIAMGKNPYPSRSEMTPAVKQSLISKGIAQATELSGIYKFALWDMPFKSTAPSTPQLADPGFMNSVTRSFYDESVGGLMGHTELLRRFVMSDYLQAQRQATNTIPNTTPTWLPGSRSSFTGNTAMGVFPGDRNYHIDFSVGDPYSKIPHGELRLPGAAREIAFRLHSGSPGVYDAVDRLMVLADVAPHSESYKHYRILVDSMLKSGTVDEYWTNKIAKTTEHVKQKMQRYQTYSRKFDGVSPQITNLVGQAENEKNQEGIRTYYTMPEQAIGTAWEVFSHDVVSRLGITVPILGPMLANKMLPMRDELEGYLKREVYDTDEYDWTKPYTTMLRPMHEQLKATDPLSATMGGFVGGVLIGANPIAKIVMSTAGAMYFGAQSSMRAISSGQVSGGYVPDYVVERRKMDEYFDNLEYMKLRRLEKEAKGAGMHDIARHFGDLKGRTVASLDFTLGAKQFVRDAIISLPSREKQLFTSSLDAGAGRKKEILQYVPEYLKPVYQAAWAKQGDTDFSYADMRKGPDTRAAEYFTQHSMPDPTWAGFHPDVPMDAVRVKTMDSVWSSVGSDVHRSGVFANVGNRLRTEFPAPDLSVYNFYQRSGLDSAARQQLEAELMQSGITDIQIDENLGSGLENIVNYDMSSRRGLEQFFSIASEVLRS